MTRTEAPDGAQLFVVERYLPDLTIDGLAGRVLDERSDRAPADHRVGVRHQESIWIPADETVISTFVAASRDELARFLRDTGLSADRIVGAHRFVPSQVRVTSLSKEHVDV